MQGQKGKIMELKTLIAECQITGTVLVIIFHLLQFLYYSERDTRQSCKLAN